MPSIAIALTPQGAFVNAFVGVSSAMYAALQAQNKQAPAPVLCRLLIDTGASNTNICQTVIAKLPIVPTGSVPVHTPSTGVVPAQMSQYDVNIYIPMNQAAPGSGLITPSVHTLANVPVIATDFSAQGFQGLLGRGALQRASFSYHGHMGLCSLSL